jgi:hypothetical protein
MTWSAVGGRPSSLSLPGVKVTVEATELEVEAEDEADLQANRPRRRALEVGRCGLTLSHPR